ncbi:hypothetical protein B484DRAFT_401782 [Ochromonadaceae sp. CCMP2298]|nr:hypothetical protein B484DRAFT_401782 [Ochromonadaceae sp. CCMP2298]
MSGQRVITDGVGVLADGQLTVNGIEAASGSFENLSSQELALHEDQIAQNMASILALQTGTNVIGTATQTALDLKLDKTAAPTRISLGIDQTDNTSDLAKPISTATQAALDDLGQTNSMAVALAQSAFYANFASAFFPPESTAAYPPASQVAMELTVHPKYNRSVTVTTPVSVNRAWNNTVWMVNAGDNDFKIDNCYPIFCSLKNAGKRDDQWLLGPGFKVVLFFYADYNIIPGARPWAGSTDFESQMRTIDNTNGRSILSRTTYQAYGINNSVNVFDKTGSLKLYYNDIEIKLQTFS